MRTYDVVIPLGDGSLYGDKELRYALRSLDRYYPNHGTVYLIGRKPDWVRNVCHIKASDEPGNIFRERNIMRKILKACDSDVSEYFVFMNDDHYLTGVIEALPFYYQCDLSETMAHRRNHDHYYHSLSNTLNTLKERGVGTLNFDVHVPILYSKRLFPYVMEQYNWNNPYGYVIKSLYSNSLEVKGVKMTDLKINSRMNCFQLEKTVGDRQFFSIGDKAISPDLFTYLQYLYPTKSQFEA